MKKLKKKTRVNALVTELKRVNKPSTTQSDNDTSICLFPKKQVFIPSSILTRLLRAICIKENITISKLRNSIKLYNYKNGRPSNKHSSDRSNLHAGISSDSVTYNRSIELLHHVLGYDVDITFHLTKDGVTKDYRESEVVKEIAEELNREQHGKQRIN